MPIRCLIRGAQLYATMLKDGAVYSLGALITDIIVLINFPLITTVVIIPVSAFH